MTGTKSNHLAEPGLIQSDTQQLLSTSIKGQFVTLERITPAHISLLFSGLGFPQNNHIVDFITGFPYVYTENELSDHIFSYLKNTPELRIYAIKASQANLGPPSLSDIHAHISVLGIMGYRLYPRSRTIKLDDLLLSPVLQGTYASTEAHYLLLCHLFEAQTIAYCRVWSTNNTLNVRCRQYMRKLGYTHEGVLRKDNVTRWGTSRDSDCFSILDGEWQSNKSVLLKWLDATNFDTDGKNITSLQKMRTLRTSSSP